MDECARGSRARTRARLLYLEPLEDRLLLSTLVAPPADPPTDSSTVQQSKVTPADASTIAGKSAASVAPPAAAGATTRQAAPLPIAPSTPAPALHSTAAAPISSPPPAPTAAGSTTYHEHDDDNPSVENAEHQEWGSAHELVAADSAGAAPLSDSDSCDQFFHPLSRATPTSGGAVVPCLPAFLGAALGVSGDALALAPMLVQQTAATDGEAVAFLPGDTEQQEPPDDLVIATKAESLQAEPMQVPHVLPAFLSPLAGLAPFDLESMEKGVDSFFAHLTERTQDWSATQVVAHATPWLLAVTAVALEIARRRRKTTEDHELEASGLPGWPGSFSGDAT